MPTVLLRHAALAAFLAVFVAACSGGGGGDDPPDLGPNTAPFVPVPSGLVGSMPTLSWRVDHTASSAVTFAAADAEGDALTWQVSVSGQTAASVGLAMPITPVGNTVRLDLSPVPAPATGIVTFLVQDPRNAGFAFDVTIVRGGAPTLTKVSPDSAFGGRPLAVELTGSSFDLAGTAAPAVRFSGLLATGVATRGNDSLQCLTPSLPQSGAVDVSVTTNYGTAALPTGAFRMLAFPPAFASLDLRVDGGVSTDAFEVALDGPRACAVTVANGQLSSAQSIDGGRTFGAPILLSGTESAGSPVVRLDGSRVLVAWIGDGGQIQLRRSDDGGATFSPAVLVGQASSPVRGLCLAASGERVHVGCIRGDGVLGAARATVTSSADGGFAFGSERLIAPATGNQFALSLGADGNSVFAVFLDERLGGAARGVHVVRSGDAGATWTGDRRISTPARAAQDLHAVTVGGAMHAVWTTSDGLFANGTIDRGVSWRTPEVLVVDNGEGVPVSPFVHVAGDRVQVVYTTNGTEVRLARSTDNGASFPVRTRLDADAGLDALPAISGTGDYTTVSWLSGDASLDAVRAVFAASTDGGAQFTAPLAFGNGASNQTDLRVLQSGGRILLAFRERRGLALGAYTNANGD